MGSFKYNDQIRKNEDGSEYIALVMSRKILIPIVVIQLLITSFLFSKLNKAFQAVLGKSLILFYY